MTRNSKSFSLVIGAVAVGVAALLWSLDGVFIRPQFYHLPAGLVVFFEHALGFLVLIPFMVRGRKEIQQLSPGGWGSLIWVSLWGGLLGTLFITKAFFAAFDPEVGTTLATVVILQKLQPVFALFLARLILKEKLNKDFYVWALVAIIAAYFLAFSHHGIHLKDIRLVDSASIYALMAAFAFGSSTVFGKRFTNELKFETATALRFGTTTVMALIFILVAKQLTGISEMQPLHWKLLVLIVFSSGALSMFIYYFGLKRIPASVATIFELVWPLSAVALDFIINKNTLTGIQYIASAVLLLAFFMIVRRKSVKEKIADKGE
ncbi:MAG: EamA family transporter [Candidatus Marinimicrobia bacterium]|nr:EamA family transporter [Candidatus Neomarinimicrobiota bacterium]